jgi:hypothetical protein
MTPEQLDAYLVVAKKHKVLAFEVGEVKVTFSQLAMVPETPANPTEMQKVADPTKKPVTFQGFTEKEIFGG